MDSSTEPDRGAPEPVDGAARAQASRGVGTAAGADTEVITRVGQKDAAAEPRRHPILRRTSIALAALLALVLATGAIAYIKLNGNISSVDLGGLLSNRPTNAAQIDPVTNEPPMNLLVLGVDDRSKLGTDKYGSAAQDPGSRSDTTMLVHLAADRKSAVVVSIPRDTMVKSPKQCKNLDDPVSAWTIGQWNMNYEEGGPACVIRTLEQLTGIPVDHFVAVDFNGFKSIVNALGSVEVCMPEAVNDPKSGLNLTAGTHELSGEQALAYVRARYTLGDGSDLGRIGRQQDFLASMARQITSTGVLLNPPKLYQVLDAITGSITADQELGSLTSLASLANQLRGLTPDQVRFVTAPTEAYAADHNRLQFTAAAADLWKLIREDAPWPGTAAATAAAQAAASASASASATATATPSASVTPVLTVKPNEITVVVENAAGVVGYGTQVSKALGVQGFQMVGITSTYQHIDGVVVHYPVGKLAEAHTVGAAFGSAATYAADGLPTDPIRVSVGVGSPKVQLVANRVGTAPLPAQPLNSDGTSSATSAATGRGTATGTATPSPTITAKVGSDSVCGS